METHIDVDCDHWFTFSLIKLLPCEILLFNFFLSTIKSALCGCFILRLNCCSS